MILLYAHVGTRKDRGGQADERRQRDQEHVERVDEELAIPREQRPVRDDLCGQRASGDERAEAERDVDVAREIAMPGEGQDHAAEERNAEDQEQDVHS